MLSVIGPLQLHPVVVDHAVGGDGAFPVQDQLQRSAPDVHLRQLLHGGAASVQLQKMLPANGLQIRKIRDDSGLLATEGQVDKVGHVVQAHLYRHSLELGQFSIGKAVQPPDQIVQLIHVDSRPLQPLEDRTGALELIQQAVPRQRRSDLQTLQHGYRAVILLLGYGERDGDHTIFRAPGVT